MKINSVIAMSLAVSSFGCLAFSSQPSVMAGEGIDNVRSLENHILGSFYSQNSVTGPTNLFGTCDASPVPGCACSFCTMLRSHNR
ncbi:hypothetical protein [Citrobacter sp. JGM124]|uniref:hypothetical protein n=1 Tax=Citrobacter sp. JGM124 TaxID=2799789 RepID=UPI001BA48528|nr:hypothetical protein [Citrobacter sp. JGM124]MBS0848348.1 hypothetical protein [Citrobacter sp. JGM124]